MAKIFRGAWLFTKNIYLSTEKAVIGKVLLHTSNTYEQAKIKLIFDYIFFYIALLMAIMLLAMISQNEINMMVIPVLIATLLSCLLLLKKGVSAAFVGLLTSLSTLSLPMLSSFFNNQDLSPKYAMIWMMSILLCYITVNLRTTLLWCLILCGYLSAVAYIKLNHLQVYVSPGYSPTFQYLSNPVIIGLYLLFLIRALGQYYRNIISMEQQRTAEKQKQHLSLINQNLTKQFLLVKGFSRSGKSAFAKGELDILDACFSEIEKQCGTAIDYLNESQEE
ncbi:hypothetical protein [Chitinophaga nivalis]|uniref:ATP-binding protein n=1 Tax=Chitinophaga nivalis TaxID=2991709 RepID=A0ABT3IPU7_9BACT|nr:hypothetical protein [Chitinophaga nivalis]MCW3464323.1 hypothetical protein [Chitinophaga nivalis]MCW3485986.1 hypothetical protein [Chitinophaga nivalis]